VCLLRVCRDVLAFPHTCAVQRGNKRLEDSGQKAPPQENVAAAAEVVELTSRIEKMLQEAEAAGACCGVVSAALLGPVVTPWQPWCDQAKKGMWTSPWS